MGLFRSLFGMKEPAPDIDLDEAEDLKPRWPRAQGRDVTAPLGTVREVESCDDLNRASVLAAQQMFERADLMKGQMNRSAASSARKAALISLSHSLSTKRKLIQKPRAPWLPVSAGQHSRCRYAKPGVSRRRHETLET